MEDVASAKWLSSGERLAITEELEREHFRDGVGEGGVWEALRSGRVWLLGLAFFIQLGMTYAITFSLPLLVGQMTGWTAGRVGYLIAGAGVLGAALMLIVASFSDRSARPQRYVVSGYLVMGVCVLAAGLHLHGWSGTAALLLFMVIYYAIQAPMLRAMTTVVPGKGSAVAIGAINTCGITGGFIGPYWMGWMRDATGSYAWGVGALCVPAVFAAVMMMYLMREKQRTSIVQVEIGFEEEAVG